MKKTYEAPKLMVHGTVEKLTQRRKKRFGFSDQFVIVQTVPGGGRGGGGGRNRPPFFSGS